MQKLSAFSLAFVASSSLASALVSITFQGGSVRESNGTTGVSNGAKVAIFADADGNSTFPDGTSLIGRTLQQSDIGTSYGGDTLIGLFDASNTINGSLGGFNGNITDLDISSLTGGATKLAIIWLPSYDGIAAITAGQEYGIFQNTSLADSQLNGGNSPLVLPLDGVNATIAYFDNVANPASNQTAADFTANLTTSGTPSPNVAPVANDASLNIAENSAANASVGSVSVTDANAGQVLSYAITAGNSENTFAINSTTGEISATGSLNHEVASSYTLTVTVTDDASPALSDTATITINVTDVDESAIAGVQAWEDALSNGSVPTLTRVTPLAGNSTTAIDLSAISGDATYEFIVEAEDLGQNNIDLLRGNNRGLKFEQWNNKNVIGATHFGVADWTFTAEPGLSTASPYGAVHQLVFVVDSSASQTRAYLDGAHIGTLSQVVDLSSASTTLGASNMRGDNSTGLHAFAAYNSALSIAEILDHKNAWFGNSAPVLADSSFSVIENSANGTAVGTLTATDADTGQTVNYTITAGNTGSAFAINSATGELTTAAALDFEALASYNLTVTATDNGSPALSDTATITINITDDTNEDSDNDGLTDAWEIQYFSNLSTTNGATDSDNDNISDADEYLFGTDPTQVGSKPRLICVDLQGGGTGTNFYGQLSAPILMTDSHSSNSLAGIWNPANGDALTSNPANLSVNPSWDNLSDSEGSITAVNLKVTGNVSFWSGHRTTTADARLHEDYMILKVIGTDTSVDFSVEGLTANGYYRLYFFGGTSTSRAIDVAVGSTNLSGVNAVAASVTLQADANGKISGTVTTPAANAEGNWSGLQIQGN